MPINRIMKSIHQTTGYIFRDMESTHIVGPYLLRTLRAIDKIIQDHKDYNYTYTYRPSFKDKATLSISHMPTGVTKVFTIGSCSRYLFSSFNHILKDQFEGIIKLTDKERVNESILEYFSSSRTMSVYHVKTRDRLIALRTDEGIKIKHYGATYPAFPNGQNGITYQPQYFKDPVKIDKDSVMYTRNKQDMVLIVEQVPHAAITSSHQKYRIFKRSTAKQDTAAIPA